MRRTCAILLSVASLCVIICAQQADVPSQVEIQPSPGNASISSLVVPADYKLAGGDVVAVTSIRTPEYDSTAAVSDQGALVFPFLSESVPANGKTAVQIAAALNENLQARGLVMEPDLQVRVAEVLSHTITVSGAVAHPVELHAVRPISLLDAIVRAGGPNVDAAGAEVTLTTTGIDGVTNSRQISYTALAAGDPQSNPMLFGGERVDIAPGGEVFVTGAVKKPGAFPLRMGDTMTVAKAMALSEGWLDDAGLSKAVVVRRALDGSVSTIPVNIDQVLKRQITDPPLQSGDLLYIPTNGKKRIGYALATGFTSSFFYAVALLASR